MVRVSSKGNPWHDELGRFCSKAEASFIKCGDDFIPCDGLSLEEKNELLNKINNTDYQKFYSKSSDKRLERAKNLSIFKPITIPEKATKKQKLKIDQKNKIARKKAVSKFIKENKYHLEHGGSFKQYTDNDGTSHFVCVNAKRIYKQTKKDGGASIDISTGMKAFNGYMVAKYPDKSKWIDAKISEKKQVEEFKKYLTNNLKELSEKNLYFGTWYDKETNKISIDISEQIGNAKKAKEIGEERNEKAIWDVKNVTEISTGGTGTNV